MSIISDLTGKVINVEDAAQQAINNPAALSELLQGILSHQDEERYNSFKTLLLVSENHPDSLYPHWGQFEDMLAGPNSNYQSIAIQILANLVRIDSDNKFETIFDRYFKIMEGDKTVTAAFIAGNAWKIAQSNPNLQSRITDQLLNIEQVHHGKQIDLVKGHAIEAFGHYYGEADTEDKKRILDFVRKEMSSKSPRTKKAAKEFLKEWE